MTPDTPNPTPEERAALIAEARAMLASLRRLPGWLNVPGSWLCDDEHDPSVYCKRCEVGRYAERLSRALSAPRPAPQVGDVAGIVAGLREWANGPARYRRESLLREAADALEASSDRDKWHRKAVDRKVDNDRLREAGSRLRDYLCDGVPWPRCDTLQVAVAAWDALVGESEEEKS